MEITTKLREKENPSSPANSQNSSGSNNNNNGVHIHTPPAVTSKLFSRSETNPYPTTFVQADTTTFKQVVQMLTGSPPETAKQGSKPPPPSDPQPPSSSSKGQIPPIKTGQKKQGFKLYERRNSLKNGLMICPLVPGSAQNPEFFRRKPDILSPSILDFPALGLSPVAPSIEEDNAFNRSSPEEEERAIAEKRFYLHPSPRTTTPRGSDLQLLALFPVMSPRVSESSSSS
ncbi:hypothetical protein U1Q18_000685 [Sarracenia purpurea var. burkii]